LVTTFSALGRAVRHALGPRHSGVACVPRVRPGEDGFCRVGGAGGDDDFGEDLDDLFRRVGIKRLIERDNTAKGRCLVAVVGAEVGVAQAGASADAAGVGVFDDGAGGAVFGGEFRHQFEGGVGVVDVVVRQLLALPLAGGGNAWAARAV